MTFFCTNATRKKPPETHSELSGRYVGGASPLIFLRGVFRGWGLKKGKNWGGPGAQGSGALCFFGKNHKKSQHYEKESCDFL